MTDFTTSNPDAELLKKRMREEAAAEKAKPAASKKTKNEEAKDPKRPFPGRVSKTQSGKGRRDN